LIVNGDFSNGSTGWNPVRASVLSTVNGVLKITYGTAGSPMAGQTVDTVVGETYKIYFETKTLNLSNNFELRVGENQQDSELLRIQNISENQSVSGQFTATSTLTQIGLLVSTSNTSGYGLVDNVSVKQLLVNRESTVNNTGIVERPITGVNESELWLDTESTSIVSNTGIVERPIVGVNESDPMFPDNTISNIVNIAGLVSSLIADLKARATTFENEDATEQILINLQKC